MVPHVFVLIVRQVHFRHCLSGKEKWLVLTLVAHFVDLSLKLSATSSHVRQHYLPPSTHYSLNIFVKYYYLQHTIP